MGAYGQSALREFFLGSVTRTVLKESSIPVFLLPLRSDSHSFFLDRSQVMNTDEFRLRRTGPRVTLLTDRAVAVRLRVSTQMVRLWVATGAWPLPRGVRGTSWLFDRSDVECWVRTGTWPAGAWFRTGVCRIVRAGFGPVRSHARPARFATPISGRRDSDVEWGAAPLKAPKEQRPKSNG